MAETWWVSPDGQAEIRAVAPLDVAAWMQRAHEGGTVLSSDRSSVAVHLPGRPDLFVKWRVPKPRKRKTTWLRASRERREAESARHLTAVGVEAPEVLAVGERRRRGILQGSVLIRRWWPDARDLRDADRDDLDAGLRALRRWHDLGFRHGDAWPKNVLRRADGALAPIGHPKAHWVPARTDNDRARWRDLAFWAAGVRQIHPGVGVAEVLDAYVAAAPFRRRPAAGPRRTGARVIALEARRPSPGPRAALEEDASRRPSPLAVDPSPEVRIRPLA